ncbi:hypothetical protein CHH28_10800 [Bacterioplanes sanyensis]|uniref:N-acetylmuramoyl-L-alanine amidase domain-containing protein n=1 Tax=Bacterioplanes sanyensis TaxID=1249553 RepID=A0A222FJG2_9GAMM|nr:peptidoglycan recognition family protein [Bacterioplanes sanyensis]ASP39138.1 hypothetical protein CHH28_10800 [Bacterioplanes sanyensis]
MASPELVINALTIAAGGALVVERVTEYLKHVQKRLDQQQAETYLQQVELDAVEQALHDVQQSPHSNDSQNASDDFERYASVPVIDNVQPSLNRAKVRLFVRLAPLALGIIIAAVMDLHLLALMRGVSVAPMADVVATGAWWVAIQQWLDTLLSGVFIAGGSQPVHILIRFLRARSALLPPPADQTELLTASPAAEAMPALLDYQGGVKPLTLDKVHRRSGDPQRIVVHHTAMHSASSFDTVVDEFLVNKGWLTGYHAIVMPDGQLHAFCRWDRRGNHAKGHNDRTLGIAFHGNFHSDGSDAWSNHDGRYGQLQPSDAQLEAGARLIAAWILLYPAMIGVDDLVPHRELLGANTVCPGNRFPWADLCQLVQRWLVTWQQPRCWAELQMLAQRPYLYHAQAPVLTRPAEPSASESSQAATSISSPATPESQEARHG